MVWKSAPFVLVWCCDKIFVPVFFSHHRKRGLCPRWGNTILFHSFQQLPCLRPLKGFFNSLSTLQGPLTSPRALIWDLKRNKDIVRSAASRKVQSLPNNVNNHHPKPWLCVCIKHTFHTDLWLKKDFEFELASVSYLVSVCDYGERGQGRGWGLLGRPWRPWPWGPRLGLTTGANWPWRPRGRRRAHWGYGQVHPGPLVQRLLGRFQGCKAKKSNQWHRKFYKRRK